jgi:hypothetical protein
METVESVENVDGRRASSVGELSELELGSCRVQETVASDLVDNSTVSGYIPCSVDLDENTLAYAVKSGT